MLDRLSSESSSNPPSDGPGHCEDRREAIIKKALGLLSGLHKDSCQRLRYSDYRPFTSRAQKLTDALLDLIVIEGIYPCLEIGVGVPMERRLTSVLKGDFVARTLGQCQEVHPHDQQLIRAIIDCLYPILMSREGLASNVEARMLVDMVAAVGQAAFSPVFAVDKRQKYLGIFKALLNRPSSDVLPMLTSLLHPSCPDWLRSPLSNRLSLFPLRPNGVRHILNFIAGSTSADEQQPADVHDDRSSAPSMTFDALARATKLLTSVPSTMTAETYFPALAPQLLDLLDDRNLDNKRIASYIIGNGILGKRKIGSPGTVGWELFAEPILETINPPVNQSAVGEKPLRLALDRLSALVQLHPNPGLTKRLVVPVLLPLWGLGCYAINHSRANWADQIHRILVVYMKLSATESQLLLLSDNLLWDGPPRWTFMPGAEGGVEIRQRETYMNQAKEWDKLVEKIDTPIDQYIRLLQAATMTDEQLSAVFTHVCKRWLNNSPAASKHDLMNVGDSNSRDPMQLLVDAKLVKRLLEEYKDQISSSLDGVLRLVEPILADYVAGKTQKTDKATTTSSLHHRLRSLAVDDDKESEEEEDSSETISTALSLLSAILTPTENPKEIDDSILQSIQDSLKYIAQATSSLDSSITTSASNILILLQLRFDISEHLRSTSTSKLVDTHAEDRQKHRTALTHLSDELAPVRAQGLSTLITLISKASPVLNIPSTSILLTSLLRDQDEYIYLSAIKAIGILASSHPRTVIQELVEQYSDPREESTLDVRLRVGEALNKTVEHLDQLFVGSVATMVSENMIAVASRRGDRSKTLQKRERATRRMEKARKEAEEAWDGEIPEEHADNDEYGALNEHIAKIVEGWADTGREEDIRIRTSALSILGTAIQTNIAGVGATITSTAIDCVLAILKLEKSTERAILRRAAVTVIMSLVKAFDNADERGLQLGFGFAGESLAEVITVLKYLEMTDKDDLVVGHVRVVIENLESWRQKSIVERLGARGLQRDVGRLDETNIAGLATRPAVRPKIEEVD
ncbi:MAG: hypothetical protein Q9215_006875 [Flavoplaca cf. flavocitrina]